MNEKNSGPLCCGAMAYSAYKVRMLWYCHCQQCRKTTLHYQAGLGNISIQEEGKWHYVSTRSQYDCCVGCGSQLFWPKDGKQYLSITAGSMNAVSRIKVGDHVFNW